MSPLKEVGGYLNAVKYERSGREGEEKKNQTDRTTRWDLNRRQTETICFQYGKMQCTHILPPTRDRKMTVSLTFLYPYLSFSVIWTERARQRLLEEHLLLICLFWPMLDLRGLISLDNKTKRVNVLIVADGAGILGKCVKLVLTSGPHSSPPCCDLLLPSLRCSLHPSHSIRSLFPRTPLHSSCDPRPSLLSPPLHPDTGRGHGG